MVAENVTPAESFRPNLLNEAVGHEKKFSLLLRIEYDFVELSVPNFRNGFG